MRKGRWHGAAVTEGSIRLDVLTKPGSTGKLGRSLSQPAADSSLYAREPPHPSRATPGPPSPEGKAASGGGLLSTCYVAYRVFLQGILPQAVTQLWKGAVGKGFYPQKYSTALLQAVEYFSQFPRRVRRQGMGERRSIRVIWFHFVLYSSLSTVISWFSTKFIHSCGYSCG